jgi:peptide/nickel transport system permease protein
MERGRIDPSTATHPAVAAAAGVEPRIRRRPSLLRQLLRKRPAQIGGAVILLLLLCAALAPAFAPYDPYRVTTADRLLPPSARHWLGTDDLGRDQFSRILHGTRTTLQVGVISVGIAIIIGVPLGVMSGYYGGWPDLLIMRWIDIMLAFPYILLALAIVATIGPSLRNAMIAIGISSIPGWVRLVRGNVLSAVRNDYVTAAQALGATDRRVMFAHVLPNTLSSVIVLATLQFPTAVLSAAALSFVGLGAQPPSPEWGALLTGARDWIWTAPWLVNFPGIAIFVTILGFNLFGNALRDTLDPTLRGS